MLNVARALSFDMKRVRYLILGVFVLLCSLDAACGQDLIRCINKIHERIEALGPGGHQEFNLSLLHDDISGYEIGKLREVVADANKKRAFHRIFESLAGFVDLAGPNLSAKAMRGYGRYAPCIINPDGMNTVNHLQQAFTKKWWFLRKELRRAHATTG
jgi:hypothetical protein